jgi:hypothetical protein
MPMEMSGLFVQIKNKKSVTSRNSVLFLCVSQRNLMSIGVEQKVLFLFLRSVAVVLSVYRMPYVKICAEILRQQLTINKIKRQKYPLFKEQL